MPEQTITKTTSTAVVPLSTPTVTSVALYNSRRNIIVALIIVGVFTVLLAAAVLFSSNTANQGTSDTSSSSSSISSSETSTESSSQSSVSSSAPAVVKVDEYVDIGNGLYRFTSDEYNITFTVVNPQHSQAVTAVREGNKVWVHMAIDTRQQGQSVEIFPKDETETLTQAIEEGFLVGFDPAECFVEINDTNGNIQTAGISFPVNENADEPWWENAENCPTDYANTNGVRFFLHDITHSDQFAFFNIGQYAINGSSESDSWFDTFEFTD